MQKQKSKEQKLLLLFLVLPPLAAPRLLAVAGYWLLVTLLTGCATMPAPKEMAFPIQKFYVHNITYYPLSSLCNHLNIPWDYDSVGRQIILKKNNTEIKLLLDSSMVLVNGYPQDMENTILMHNGVVAVPHKLKETVLDRLYGVSPPQITPPPVSIYKIRRIVVDAGHGGHDPGAIGRTGLREKDVNLDIARRLSKLLEAQGIEVVMTRSTDKFLSLEGRAEMGNKSNADFFVSVHSNSSRSRKLNGFEVYYITENIDDAARAQAQAVKGTGLSQGLGTIYKESQDLKTVLWDMLYTKNRADSILLAQSICQAANHGMGLKVLGVKGAPFYVLKGTRIPAVLVEVGFVSHPEEEKFLRNPFYRQQIAEVIADGIIDYGRRYDLPR